MSNKKVLLHEGRLVVYCYDADSLEYTGKDIADTSPLDPDEFLIPANSTAVKPPEAKKGKVLVFNGKKWIYTELKKSKQYNVLSIHAREHRNSLLAQSDWTQGLDVPEYVDRKAWRRYRQELRDITAHPEFPLNFTFPEQPKNKKS